MKKIRMKLMNAASRPPKETSLLAAISSRRPALGRTKADPAAEMAKPDRAFWNPRTNAGIAASIAALKRRPRH